MQLALMESETNVPSSAGVCEFPRLQDGLAEIENMLALAMPGTSRGATADVEAGALAAHARACAALEQLEPRAQVFERRALERDPEKRIYGPKMSRRVLDFCDALQSAARHCAELREALSPARRRRADAEAAGLAAAAVEAANRVASEAATAARACEEEIARVAQADAEAPQRAVSNTLSSTAGSTPMHTLSPSQGFRSQWIELDGLARKMARVMPRASTSW